MVVAESFTEAKKQLDERTQSKIGSEWGLNDADEYVKSFPAKKEKKKE